MRSVLLETRIALRSKFGTGPVPSTVLIVSDGEEFTSEQQFAPIKRHATLVAATHGIVFTFENVSTALRRSARSLRKFDAVGLKLSFRTTATEATRIVKRFSDALKGSGKTLLYFDGDDDLAVLWPDVLDTCDIYIKKHIFSDKNMYLQGFKGKSNLTDYVCRTFETSFEDDIIPQTSPLTVAAIPKIVLGWNIAMDDKIADLAASPFVSNARERDIDISCRASVPEDVWTHPIRDAAVCAIEALGDRYKVFAPTSRVPQDVYYDELLRSRISVSPFGFGELCWRDFEVILCGALLVKPDMSHVRTYPDLFIPGETYVPVSWDYSDLPQVCDRYLSDKEARLRITAEAKRRLLAALEPQSFVYVFGEVMMATGIISENRAVAP